MTREDILPGYQGVQAGHAAIKFQWEHSQLAKNWFDNSQYLIYLTVPGESFLEILIDKAQRRGICYSVFREPDIDNQITAVAFEPGDETRKLTQHLPLMLKKLQES